jgi:LytS/YehU family sensor histidine kinase
MALTLVLWLVLGYYSYKSIPFLNNEYGVFFKSTLTARILAGMMQYILLILVYYVIMYYHNFREKITRETALEANIKSAELNALKSQINPHFLFNSLNSISALTLDSPEKARDMVQKLSDFLRDSISQMDDRRRRFEEEMTHISHYLDIEKVRFGERMIVEMDVAKKCDDAVVPHMIIQPLVENAIKHGVGESTEKVNLKIVADCFHGYLKVQVENNFDPEYQNKAGTGIGMDNIRKRLELIYSREDLMSVATDNNIFRVTLNFPQNGLE